MPTPVSTFSPFTPFTPASSNHNSGGYFDRPTTSNIGIGSPLGRRPDLRTSGVGSSSLLRISRMAGPADSLRPPPENGWRIASRMREEAWSAWEQQLGNSNVGNINNINLSTDILRLSSRPISGHTNLEEFQAEKRPSAVPDGIKISSSPLRSPSESHITQSINGPFRSNSANDFPRPPKPEIKQHSFDPSFLPNRARFPEIRKGPVN